MSVPLSNIRDVWSNSSIAYNTLKLSVNANSYNATSNVVDYKVNDNSIFRIGPSGIVNVSNALFVSSLNLVPAIVAAFGVANSAGGGSGAAITAAYAQANVVTSNVNYTNTATIASFTKANTANTIAFAAFDRANIAVANATFTNTMAQAAFASANVANIAFDKANSANIIAAGSMARVNIAIANINYVNTSTNAAFTLANSTNIITFAAFAQANVANASVSFVNTAMQAAYATANSAGGGSGAAIAVIAANVNYTNTAMQAAFATANAAGGGSGAAIAAAYGQANTATLNVNYSNTATIAAFTQANTANTRAYTSFQNTTGTLSGTLTTTGQIIANGGLLITANDGASEGGEINLLGSGGYDTKTIDSYQDVVRIFTLSSNNNLLEINNAGSGSMGMTVKSYALVAGTNVVPVLVSSFARANIAIANVSYTNTAMQASFAKTNLAYTAVASAYDKANTGAIGGSTTQIQFNDAGALNGSANLIFDKAWGKVQIGPGPTTAAYLTINTDNIYDGTNYGRGIQVTRGVDGAQHASFVKYGTWVNSLGYVPGAGQTTFGFGQGKTTDSDFTPNFLSMSSAGNVGVGTASPAYKLDVNGTLSFTGLASPTKAGLQYVTPQMYGAAGDGTTDDTTALTNALNSGYPVHLHGKFRVTSEIAVYTSASNPTITIFGSGQHASEIILDHGGSGNGLVFYLTTIRNPWGDDSGYTFHPPGQPSGHDSHAVTLRDFTIVPNSTSTGSALAIRMNDTSYTYTNVSFSRWAIGSDEPTVRIDNVHIIPSSTSYYYTIGFNFYNLNNVFMSNSTAKGHYGNFDGWAVLWGGQSGRAPVEFHVTDCTFTWWSIGMYLSPNTEGATSGSNDYQGVYVTACTFLSCDYGLLATSTDNFADLINVMGGHFNYRTAGIYTSKVGHVSATAVAFLKGSSSGGSNSYGVFQNESGTYGGGIIQGCNFLNGAGDTGVSWAVYCSGSPGGDGTGKGIVTNNTSKNNLAGGGYVSGFELGSLGRDPLYDATTVASNFSA